MTRKIKIRDFVTDYFNGEEIPNFACKLFLFV